MRGLFGALQLLMAFSLAILGLAMAFRAANSEALLLGALLGGTGLSLLVSWVINQRKLS